MYKISCIFCYFLAQLTHYNNLCTLWCLSNLSCDRKKGKRQQDWVSGANNNYYTYTLHIVLIIIEGRSVRRSRFCDCLLDKFKCTNISFEYSFYCLFRVETVGGTPLMKMFIDYCSCCYQSVSVICSPWSCCCTWWSWNCNYKGGATKMYQMFDKFISNSTAKI